MAKKSEHQAGIFARLIIIAYALGIVAIGVYSIRQQHGSVINYLSKQSSALADNYRINKNSSKNIDEPVPRVIKPPLSRDTKSSNNNKNNYDHITPTDRKQLNNLLEKL
jgi:hypothetical protein